MIVNMTDYFKSDLEMCDSDVNELDQWCQRCKDLQVIRKQLSLFNQTCYMIGRVGFHWPHCSVWFSAQQTKLGGSISDKASRAWFTPTTGFSLILANRKQFEYIAKMGRFWYINVLRSEAVWWSEGKTFWGYCSLWSYFRFPLYRLPGPSV